MKTKFNFCDFALLRKEAENLERNGYTVYHITLERALDASNLDNNWRFRSPESRTALLALNVEEFEVLPSFSMFAQNGNPSEGYICEFNGFIIRDSIKGDAYIVNTDKNGKLYLFSPVEWKRKEAFRTNLVEPCHIGKVTVKKVRAWFAYLRALDAEILAFNDLTNSRSEKALSKLASLPNATRKGNTVTIIEGGIRYEYNVSDNENGVYRTMAIDYNSLVSTEDFLRRAGE